MSINAELTYFISGKMTGEPELGTPIFNEAAKTLREHGLLRLWNPADVGIHDDWSWQDYMDIALQALRKSDVIVLLPHWYQSKGSRQEVVKSIEWGLDIIPYKDLLKQF